MNSEIKPFWPGVKLAGPALTVRCHAVGDNLTLHKAIELIQPGDVIVVDAGGYKETGGMWGRNNEAFGGAEDEVLRES